MSPFLGFGSRRRLFGILGLVALCACQRAETQGITQASATAEETKLLVFAAASLQDAFGKLGDAFESAHPGVDVEFSFAGSQELRAQLEHGARADVFASADQRNMDELVRQKLVLAPAIFARNEPVIVVSNDCKVAVNTLADLPLLSRIVLGTPEVPIGRYSLQILDRAGSQLGADFRSRVEVKVVSRELNVRQALARVTLGEAEASIVYRTDSVVAAGKVRAVSIPPEFNVIAEYPIAQSANAEHPSMASEWIALLTSPSGQQLLTATGFLLAAAPKAPVP